MRRWIVKEGWSLQDGGRKPCVRTRRRVNGQNVKESIGKNNEWGAESELGGGQAAELESWHKMMTGSEMMTRKR